MIFIANSDRKKYFVKSEGKTEVLGAYSQITVESNDFTLTRAYSGNAFLSALIKSLIFLLYLLFVFVDPAEFAESKDFSAINVRLDFKSNRPMTVTIMPGALLNVEADADAEQTYTVGKSFMLAHLLSMFLYVLGVIGLFTAFTISSFEYGVKWGVLMCFVTSLFVAAGAVICVFAVKSYRKNRAFFNNYYKNDFYEIETEK